MSYEEMSDFEINHKVANKFGLNIKCIKVDSDDEFNLVMIGKKYTRDLIPFDPCNSWADAGPIIHDRGISLYHDDDNWQAEITFLAPTGKYELEEPASKVVWNKNPLRAAMIVFLMMQEYDNG